MPQLLSTKNLLLSHDPLVVGVIHTASLLEGMSQISLPPETCDALELRLDSIDLPIAEIHAHAAKLPLPLIITARHPDEGGIGNLSSSQRLALLESHLDVAALIDIELRSAPEFMALIQKAKSKHIGVIGSFHNFHATPSDDVLQGAVDFAIQFKMDTVKVATALREPSDMARLILLLTKEKRLRVSAMGMGELGPVSRLALARSGSLLNYGYLGQSNAPGQLAAPRLKELLTEL